MDIARSGRVRIMAVVLATWLPLAAPRTAAAADGAEAQRGGGRHVDDARDAADDQQAEDLRASASQTLSLGQFERARRQFEQVLKMLPYDAPAQRDAARAAQAAGEFEYAAAALERAHHFEKHAQDPELHYLRGEALYVLKRDDEARREHRIAELEIGQDPKQRLSKLWLARIYARRGMLWRADPLYESMWPAAPALDLEVAINHADAHLMHEDWSGGETVLMRLLARDPKNVRAREMLAWALEAKGDLDKELAVRASLAADVPTARNWRDWGRAQERAADYRAAYRSYAVARAKGGGVGDEALIASINRMRYRTTPETAAVITARRDPQAASIRGQVGLAFPFGPRHNLSVIGWRDASYSQALRGNILIPGNGEVNALSAALFLGSRRGASLILGGEARQVSLWLDDPVIGGERHQTFAGGMGELVLPLFGHAEVNVHGDLNTQWNDSAITVSEGGSMHGGTGHLYLFPENRWFLIDLGAQLRRLRLMPYQSSENAVADQRLFFAGLDVLLWSSATRVMKMESLDEALVRRTYLNDAGILSYRHYRLDGDSSPDFASRLVLAPRAAIHMGSATMRKVFLRGRGGVEVRGGVGYDTARLLALYSAGGSLVVAPSWIGRFLVSYEYAKETATGIQGERHTGWVSYHADL
jgi:tetratricopeptide (TPR) repeat protein